MNKIFPNKLFIANRGEIALRILTTAHRMGIQTVVPITREEQEGDVARAAHQTALFEGHLLSDTYLNADRLISMALKYGAEAIHPGYGFLSENADFAQKVKDAGLIWIGPSPETIAMMGHKEEARRLARTSGVPITPGASGTMESLLEQKDQLPYPLLIKAAAGGGGKGMKMVSSPDQLKAHLEVATREAYSYFGDATVYVEQYLESPRHIEVQVLGDQHNHLIHLFERECSIQRRFQKIIEEAPSPAVNETLREKLTRDALRLCRQIGYHSAGTVEFLVDRNGQHYFLEMNTRIQVEHPVTEAITGIDLVEQQIRLASGLPLTIKQEDLTINGHALETRLYAEDPRSDFRPAPGPISYVTWPNPHQARTDTFFGGPTEILPHFDPLLAKIITHRPNRALAIDAMQKALAQTVLIGTTTNLSFLQKVLKEKEFLSGQTDTHFIDNQMDVHNQTKQAHGAEKTEILLAAYTVWFRLFRHPNPGNLWNQLGHKRWCGKTLVWFNQKPYVIQTERAYSSKSLTWSINQEGKSGISDANLKDHRLSFSMNECNYEFAWHYGESKELLLYGDGLTHSFRPGFAGGDLSPKEELNTATSPNHLEAPIPGRIVKINVSAGEKVEKGAPILILEAMKMENLLTSQTRGIVKEVLVASGQQVKSGQKLVLFEKEPLKTNEIAAQIIIKN